MLVGTDVFTGLADACASAIGLNDLPLAVTTHPIGGLPADAVGERAASLVTRVCALLTESP